jgi:hypothetical protein
LTPAQRSNVLNARGIKRNISAIETECYDKTGRYNEMNPGAMFHQDYFNDGYTTMTPDDSLLQHCDTEMELTPTVGAVTTITDPEQLNMNAGDQFGQRSRLHSYDQSRYIGMFQSSSRRIVKKKPTITISQVNATMEQMHVQSFIELDSHADTSCVGANC